jgi:hypothetical protein
VIEPEFNDGRLKGIVGEASESDSENATDNLATQLGTFVKDMGNEFMRQNAEQRSRAGFKVTVTRTGGAKCCPWCADRTGKWELANAPDGVFGCHDNCKCMVDYTNSKGTVRGRAVTHKIDGKTVTKWEFADKIPYTPPRVLTKEEAAARGGFDKPKRLTGAENGGIIKLEDFSPLSPEKVVNHLRDRSKSWIESLTLEEIRSVMKYTQNIGDTKNNKFFERLNSALRGEKPLDDHLIFHSNNISAAIEKFKLNDDIICYRSTKKNYFAQHKIGDIFSAGYFLSSSASKKGALKGQFTTIIRAPKGSKCAYIEKLSKYPAQREVLFDKNCRYKVLEESNNYMIIEVLTDDR